MVPTTSSNVPLGVVVLARKGNIRRPQCGVRPVLEYEMGRDILVGAHMLIEDGLLAKVLAALGAGEGLLTRMDAYMLVKNGALPEAARTVRAGEGFFVGVDS